VTAPNRLAAVALRPPQRPLSWWQAARLALGTAAALGLARFAYGLLVPAMRGQLGWSLAKAGALTTANGLGYLVGALASAAVARRVTVAVTFRLGMAATATALAATAVSRNYAVLLAARAAAGLAGALVFVSGGVLAARIATAARTATPITLYYAGAGLGIALSGAAIPLLLQGHPDRWPLAWVGLALATAASWGAARSDGDQAARPTGRRRLRPLWPIAIAYVLFATGYLAYLTFLSVYLVDHYATATQVALTWSLLGAAVLAAPSLWSRPMTSWPGTRALATLLLALGAAAALPLLSPAAPLVLASAVAYGATLMSVPAAVTALVRTSTAPDDWTPTLATLTTLFAAGQAAGPWAAGPWAAGPWAAGALAELTTSDAGLAWTAALCAAAGALATTQRPTPPP
jgi:predicted MFS family arabinose efflux permease